jgi:hypothetical protein
MVPVAVVRHQRVPLVLLVPELLPVDEPAVPLEPEPVELPAPVPLLPPLMPAPESVVVVVLEMEPETLGVVALVVVEVVSLVVDEVVGEVEVVVVLEPGVALVPELL